MFVRKLVFFFLFSVLCLKAFPAVFTVTSNADSGPGTLRDALTQAAANGSATQDIIQFNLPDLSVAGRTIMLLNVLPDVSSNLLIDASTQPGNKLGISNAKVILMQNTAQGYPFNSYAFRGLNVSDVEIDGFYFSLFASSSYNGVGISFTKSTNITIGNKNKGNVFGLTETPVSCIYCNHIVVAANMFGIDPLTSSIAGDAWTSGLRINACNDITIGGDDPSYGNTFVYAVYNLGSFITGYDPQTGSVPFDSDICIFKNNTVGYYASNMRVHASIFFEHIKHLEITSNTINYSSAFLISYISGDVLIRGNQCNIDPVNLNGNSSAATPYELFYVKKAIIGGTGPNDANSVINNGYPGNGYEAINTYQCEDILIQRNSIGCKTPLAVYVARESKVELPVVSINYALGNLIKGKATPGSEVEVFSDSECQLCEPTHYLGSVTANPDSSWSFTYSGTPTAYTASASINGRTSLFTKIGMEIDNAIIKNPSCGNQNGSIKGIKVVNSTKIEWTDQNGKVISNSLDIENLPPGVYTFTAYQAQFCKTQSVPFVLHDTQPQIDDTFLQLTQNKCGGKNGAIEGLNFKNGSDFTAQSMSWTNQNGQVAGNGLNLENIPAGNYTFTVTTIDNCTVTYGPVSIKNILGPNVDPSQVIITPSNCGQANGSIANLKMTSSGSIKYSWINASTRQEVATTADLLNQPAGSYLLTVSNTDGTCPQQYGPVLITNTGGPVIDDSNVKLFDANCNNNGGSITGIKATGAGNLTYTWTNSRGTVVGNSLDLANIGAGAYTLTVTDQSQCGANYSLPYTLIAQTGVGIDQTNLKVTPTSCGSYGSVTGLSGDGPLNFVWRDDSGTIVSNMADLLNATGGTYTLTVSNACGTRSTFTFDLGAKRLQVPVLNSTVTSACIGMAAGSISIQTDPSVKSYRWVDGQGTTISNGPSISNIAAGSYQLYITDQNGCESFYKTYTVPEIAQLQLIQGSAQITDDQCSLKTGSIKNIQVTGGTAPYNYTWANAAGQTISTSADISGLGPGDYTLTVTDASNCNIATNQYTIQETESITPAPTANNVEVCSSGDAFISVNNPSSAFTYRLYDDQNSAQPLDEENSGRFKVTVNNNRSYFISQLNGTCESSRSEVKVTVGVSAVNIPNAFTPNGDGINDYWSLKGMENNPNSLVQVFTRYGQKIFESKGYEHPFDGTYGGKELPSGVYYYIINLGTNCNILSGNVTIIR